MTMKDSTLKKARNDPGLSIPKTLERAERYSYFENLEEGATIATGCFY